MSFSIVFGVLKTLEACVIVLIKVTFIPTPIFGIINGTCLGITCYSNSFTYVLTTIIGISIDFMGKYRVQEIMASSNVDYEW